LVSRASCSSRPRRSSFRSRFTGVCVCFARVAIFSFFQFAFFSFCR
jgi:hypothetical protein